MRPTIESVMTKSAKTLIFLAVVYCVLLLVLSLTSPDASILTFEALVLMALTGLVAALLSNAEGQISKIRVRAVAVCSSLLVISGPILIFDSTRNSVLYC